MGRQGRNSALATQNGSKRKGVRSTQSGCTLCSVQAVTIETSWFNCQQPYRDLITANKNTMDIYITSTDSHVFNCIHHLFTHQLVSLQRRMLFCLFVHLYDIILHHPVHRSTSSHLLTHRLTDRPAWFGSRLRPLFGSLPGGIHAW